VTEDSLALLIAAAIGVAGAVVVALDGQGFGAVVGAFFFVGFLAALFLLPGKK
jgi:hypothetical protein